MRVMVQDNLDTYDQFLDREFDLEGDMATIRDLLMAVTARSGGLYQMISSATNDVEPSEYMVLLRGSAYQFLPERLETELREGDKVRILRAMDMMSGG